MLFSADPVTLDYEIYFPPFPSLTNTDKLTIDIIPNNLEIKRALFSMQGLKAPGPDCSNPSFTRNIGTMSGPQFVLSLKTVLLTENSPLILIIL